MFEPKAKYAGSQVDVPDCFGISGREACDVTAG